MARNFAAGVNGSPPPSFAVTSATSQPAGPRDAKPSRRWVVAAIALVAAIVVVVGAYAFYLMPHSATGAGPTVLTPEGTAYTLPGDQFNGVQFNSSSPVVVNGTISDSYGLVLYAMNPSQFEYLSKKGVVGTYQWTSGPIGNDTTTFLNLPLPAGEWVIVFLNPSPINPTGIGFFTDLTLRSA